MYRELSFEDLKYKFNIDNIKIEDLENYNLIEYKDVYKAIKKMLELNGVGYNLYIIDDSTEDKIENLISYVDELLKLKESPKDLCFVTYEDKEEPLCIVLENSKGKIFKEEIDNLKEKYLDLVFDFYNTSVCTEKEELLANIVDSKEKLVEILIKLAEDKGFEIKVQKQSFVFSPIKDGKTLSDAEFEDLDKEERKSILIDLNELKNKSKELIKDLKTAELNSILEIRDILNKFLKESMEESKKLICDIFKEDEKCLEYIEYICENIEEKIVDNYSSKFNQDELLINDIVYNHEVHVFVDNSDFKYPRVIYEDNPSIYDLIGKIQHENSNGSYNTSLKDIKAGDLFKCNEGCLIMKVEDLMNYSQSYSFLKKMLLSEDVNFDFSKSYLDILSLRAIRPDRINIKPKIILIGSYKNFQLLYNYDEEFRKIFRLKCESDYVKDINLESKEALIKNIFKICKRYSCNSVTEKGIKEIARYLSKECENKNKISFDNLKLTNLIVNANNYSMNKNKIEIDEEDILETLKENKLLEEQYLESYTEKHIIMKIDEKITGSINGLSVIDAGYTRFGKPLRITCACYKGHGNIVDVQKESNLSGKIHNKSINILKGLLSNLLGAYEELPVDFHLNFEQIYGTVEGDSASVAEIVAIISSLSKVPIKQNIAVTGSINQFGEIQCIGGVNDKIEGFVRVTESLNKLHDIGVLIPSSNVNSIVLEPFVESLIEKGILKIYTMDTLDDAIDVLMGDLYINSKDIMELCKKELKKYVSKNKKEK